MKVLVINAGSSSLKFQVIDMENKQVIAKGNVERINEGASFLKYKANGNEFKFEQDIRNHSEGLALVIEKLTDDKVGVLSGLDEIGAIGHRVVNAGEDHFDSVLIDDEILENLRLNVDFAPLHIPGSIAGIESAMKICPGKPNVAVFDIGFHKSIPEYVYRYAIPKRYYEQYKIRRYGAHGTSHYYVTQRCAELLGKKPEEVSLVSCHIGSGASITAVKNGKSFDTSMGFTPLDGFMMGTRCGTMDPSVLTYIAKKENLSPDDINNICNKKSGTLGVSCLTNDNRDLVDAAAAGNEKAALALEMQRYQIVKFIGSYIAAMNGVDCLVFAGGIGENNPELRVDICKNLEYMGIEIDPVPNKVRGEEIKLSTPNSKVNVYVIPTNEELAIARDTVRIISK